MKDFSLPLKMSVLVIAFSFNFSANAAVSEADAAKLNNELTPFGAEKSGNQDGTIPAWDGGYTKAIPGNYPEGRRADPFKDEKPLYSITSSNYGQYTAHLADGTQALFKKYPDYRIDVYKTHRTAAAPQWVYANTLKNASSATMNGDTPQGIFGGIPFPIPQSGAEIMWNHLLRWRAPSVNFSVTEYQITANGKTVLTSDLSADQQMPYYLQRSNVEEFGQQKEYWLFRALTNAPALRAGEALLTRMQIDGAKDQTWVYLTGQRRVRKLPNPCCDTPTPAAAGVMSFDEIETWTGRLDRFDWKIVGKKEMLIPYNNNKFFTVKDADVLGKFPNPDVMRWELHRVWVVDASLRAGQRHQAPKSRYYCDEDTWQCMIADRWDANGQLWKTLWSTNLVVPDLPGTVTGPFGFNDLLSGAGFIGNLYGNKDKQYVVKTDIPTSVFSPDAMAGEGVR